MEKEIFKDIEGYEGKYQISSLGNIMSLNYSKSGYERILKPGKNKAGYLSVILCKYGIRKKYLVHRLVCSSFIDNTKNKKEVNHKNGIKNDNRLENLEWCTSSENGIHSHRVLLHKNHFQTNHPFKGKFGIFHPKSKKVNQYDLNGTFIRIYNSTMDIQKELGIAQTSITKCCKGKLKSAGKYKWKYN